MNDYRKRAADLQSSVKLSDSMTVYEIEYDERPCVRPSCTVARMWSSWASYLDSLNEQVRLGEALPAADLLGHHR